ncbi:serralysin [Bombiscardovia nodaiensis]|uniref:Serralysin n=1 Tax=Bombiscardovia nodaiensis TaxID=2932181 RepID=A0ABN6SD79_9BIFI|nr:serralysin [Bombiscardovia nodaiensis]
MADEHMVSIIEERMDRLLGEYLDQWSGASAGLPDQLVRAVSQQARASNQGGKRLRAQLLIASYSAACTRSVSSQPPAVPVPDDVLDLACALELFQTAALVHDDIIDAASQRRGQPSAYVALSARLAELSGQPIDDSIEGGQALGILLGDILAAAATATASRACELLPQASSIRQAFLDMEGAVDFGQVLDLAMESMDMNDTQALTAASWQTMVKKTASYTCIAPLELGWLAAGVSANVAHNTALAAGTDLGVAYQLHDDLIDITAQGGSSGKPVGGDIREGKRTWLLAQALNLSCANQRQEIISYYQSAQRDTNAVEAVSRIFADCGALDATRQRIGQLRSSGGRQLQEACQQLGVSQAGAELLDQALVQLLPMD